MSDEAQKWAAAKALLGEESLTLGPYFTHMLRRTPRRLLHMLSYYKFAAKMIGPGKRVVEIGCNEGLGTVTLAEFAQSCIGVDLDAPAIAVANATLADEKLSFRCADIMTSDDLGPFDAAVSLDVIEHIYQEHEESFMAAIARKLEPDGVFVLGTPNINSDQYAGPHSRAGHVNLFSADRLRALSERYYRNVFLFSGNDEVVHTGFTPMAYYLIALCAGPRPQPLR